jgi:hypothetical protein
MPESVLLDWERHLVFSSRLMGLGAAVAATPGAALARQGDGGTFQATGLDHVALNVRSVPVPVTSTSSTWG